MSRASPSQAFMDSHVYPEEIQRNIIAERMLGLPREPRPPSGAS